MSRARDIITEYGLEEAFRAGVKFEKPFSNFKSRANARTKPARDFGSRIAKKTGSAAKSVWGNREKYKATAKERFKSGRASMNKKSGIFGRSVSDVAKSAKNKVDKALNRDKKTTRGSAFRKTAGGSTFRKSTWGKPGSNQPREREGKVINKRAVVPTGKRTSDILTGRTRKS